MFRELVRGKGKDYPGEDTLKGLGGRLKKGGIKF